MKKDAKEVKIGTSKKKPKTQIEKAQCRILLKNGHALAIFNSKDELYNKIQDEKNNTQEGYVSVQIPVQDNDFPECMNKVYAKVMSGDISAFFPSEQSFEMIK